MMQRAEAKTAKQLTLHVEELRGCARCEAMVGPVVAPPPVVSRVYLVGQAPGPHEASLGRPFAWTAGKTLFRWFEGIGLDEAQFRRRVFMAAVCRCFPGKNPKGGDRVPNDTEIAACKPWLDREIELLAPRLIIPVGKLAIAQFLDEAPLPGVIWIREGELQFTMQSDWAGLDGGAIRALLERQGALVSALDRTA
jgi:uracil-DNA glycosylase